MRIGIYGYGNLGKGVEDAIRRNPDMELAAVFTRRDPASLQLAAENVPVISTGQALEWKDKIDVMILCGGSATDLPQMSPELAAHFHIVDSYDNHSSIPKHWAAVDAAAKREKKGVQAQYDEQIASLEETLTTAKEACWLYEKFGEGEYADVLGLCKLASRAEIEEKGWSLTPGAYVGVAPVADDGVDFHERMREIHAELRELQAKSNELMETISRNMEEMGL